MAKYRKKPIEIEAEIYHKGLEDGFTCSGFNHPMFCCYIKETKGCKFCNQYKPYINTLKGKMIISENDYIITGINGEKYPCKPDIFEKTYEKLKDYSDWIQELEVDNVPEMRHISEGFDLDIKYNGSIKNMLKDKFKKFFKNSN